MSDIVERARNRNTPYGANELIDKLADEIERLREELQDYQDRSFKERHDLRAMNDELGKANQWQRAENDRLIASNAEMLAVLHKILKANAEFRNSLPPDWEGDPLNDACEQASAAIKKAEGHD